MANGTLSEEVRRKRLAEQWSPAEDEIDQEDVDLENEPVLEEPPPAPEELEPEEPEAKEQPEPERRAAEPAPVSRVPGRVQHFEDYSVPPAPAPPAEPLGPPTKFLGEEGVDITPTPPKIEPAAPAAPEAGFLGEQGVDVVPTAPKIQPGEAVIKPEKPLPPAKPLEPEPEPEVDIPATSYRPGRGGQEPQYIVLHSSDGHEKGDINTLTQGNVSSHYYTTKDGRSMHFVPEADTAHHAGRDRYGGDGNPYTIGIEQEHIDGEEEWSDDQVRATARTVAGIMRRHPDIPLENVIGHADLAGERKQDPLDFPWETFRKYVTTYLRGGEPREAAREGVAKAGPGRVQHFEDYAQTTQVETRDAEGNIILTPVTVEGRPDVTRRARPAGQSEYGYYPGEKREDFVYGNATTFGDAEDRRRYADARAHGLSEAEARAVGDNGRGAASQGGLYTPDTYGVAVPHDVLVERFGNNPAAWRRVRVDIVTPDGRRLRVPIVDIGPGAGPQARGVAADFTPRLAAQIGTEGKFAFKLVPDAGPDVNKDPRMWQSEQSAIAQGIDLSGIAKEHQRFERPQVAGKTMTDEEMARAAVKRDEAMTRQHDIITKLPEAQISWLPDAQQSPVQLFKRLNTRVEGVSDAFRHQYQEQVKTEIIKEAQDFYKEPDPQKAFERATSDANFLTVGEEMGRKLMAFYS